MGNLIVNKKRSALEFPLLDLDTEVNNLYNNNIIDFLESITVKITTLGEKFNKIDQNYIKNTEKLNEKINEHIYKLTEENNFIKKDLTLLLENDKILRARLEKVEKLLINYNTNKPFKSVNVNVNENENDNNNVNVNVNENVNENVNVNKQKEQEEQENNSKCYDNYDDYDDYDDNDNDNDNDNDDIRSRGDSFNINNDISSIFID